jgi:hypothetical protein
MGLILALLVGGEAIATMVTLSASQDNTLYEDVTGTTSNGAGDWFFAGNTLTSQARRGLIAFDFGSIPAGSTIHTVTLALEMDKTRSGAQSIGLHRVTSNWGEGTSDAPGEEGMGAPATVNDATWLHTFSDGAGGGTTWTSVGGDFVAGASATTSVTFQYGSYTWGSTAPMVADVQNWLDGAQPNFGWLVMGNEATSLTAKRFQSRENSLHPPALTIDYTVPEPSAFVLFGFVTALGLSLHRTNCPQVGS